MRTALVEPDAGLHAICDACGVAWRGTRDTGAVPLPPASYPGGLMLVADQPRRPRIKTLWTCGEWRCERDGLIVQLYRNDVLANALTVPDENHVRKCASQWLASVPCTRRPPAARTQVAEKN